MQRRLTAIGPDMKNRRSAFKERRNLQQSLFDLPPFPTTTIGSFPQTDQIRKARADFKAGTLDAAGYERAMQAEIRSPPSSVQEKYRPGRAGAWRGRAQRHGGVFRRAVERVRVHAERLGPSGHDMLEPAASLTAQSTAVLLGWPRCNREVGYINLAQATLLVAVDTTCPECSPRQVLCPDS